MDATTLYRAATLDLAAGAGEARMLAPAPHPEPMLRLEHEPGPRGGTWVASDERGERVYWLGSRPARGTRAGVRDAAGNERGSRGERVLALVEHVTIWRGGRPYACLYHPGGGAHRDRWFVEVGEREGWVVLTDSSGMRVFSGGLEVARSVRGNGGDSPVLVKLAADVDAPLVLLLTKLLCVPEEPRAPVVVPLGPGARREGKVVQDDATAEA
jgi:hypothetical protein